MPLIKRVQAEVEEVVKPPKRDMNLSMNGLDSDINRYLKYTTYSPEHKFWLDTGSPYLNTVFGSRKVGIPYGKIIEVAGVKHAGKTTLASYIGGLAQKDGAGFIYIDVEQSRDRKWHEKAGADWDNTHFIYPKLMLSKKSDILPRLESAEELFAETETAAAILFKRGYRKQFWMLDSLAQLSTASVISAGSTEQNMRTKADRSMFFAMNLPRWAGLAHNYNAMVVVCNHIRTKVGVMFGNPEYSPGGSAKEHVMSTQVWVRRLSNGRVLKNGRVIGLLGSMTNVKNKTGEGSVEQEKAAFRVLFNRTPARWEFMSIDEGKKLLKGED